LYDKSRLGTLAGHSPKPESPPVNIAQIMLPSMCSALAVYLAGLMIQRRHHRAERDAAAGRAITVSGAIRPTDRARPGGIWRHGTLNIHGGQVIWRPYAPWGRPMVLGDLGFALRRSPHGATRFQLAPAAVVVPCSSAQRGYELAILPATVKYLFWAQVA
jgi:hypothetical protein